VNVIKKILLVSVLCTTALTLVACAGAGRSSGTFGAAAVVTPSTPSLASRGVEASTSAVSNPRAIADMKELSSHQGRPTYRVGPSDLLEIKVFQADELSRQVRVDQRGNITLPLMGTIRVAGLSQGELEKRLADLLGKNLLQNPQVSVFIKEFTAQRVTVEGEVKQQGVFPISGQVSVLQVIAMAGGLSDLAIANKVMLFRKQSNGVRTYQIDLDMIRNGTANDPYVQNDDRIVVQRDVERRVTVEGEVKRAGVYPYKEQVTVLQAVAMAGGLSNLARADSIAVIRRENGRENIYAVNLQDIRSGKSVDPLVQNEDRIVVDRSNGRFWLKEVAPLLSPLSVVTGWLGG
jgi:polysaccharide export outer membrane protein